MSNFRPIVVTLALAFCLPALGADDSIVTTLMTKELEGSIVMQVSGGEEVTLTPGQTFYEGPDDIHSVGRNASRTEPAK